MDDKIIVDEEIYLDLISEKHATALLALTDDNRNYLRAWLPWVDWMNTTLDFLSYIERCKMQHAAGTDYNYTVFFKNQPVGRIGIHYIDRQNKIGSIGYWLAQKVNGKGVITRCCSQLLQLAFSDLQLNRIEIRCAVGNERSAAIPRRLQFVHEGILRQAEWVNGTFVDLHLFAMLHRDWHANHTNKDHPAKRNHHHE